MADTFVLAAAVRAVDASPLPLPTDDALAALELHGPRILELGAGAGVWTALLRARRQVECCACDAAPAPAHTFTEVERCASLVEAARLHAPTHTLLLVGRDDVEALRAFADAGGSLVAHVGALPSCVLALSEFASTVALLFERMVSVALPADATPPQQLTIWKRRAAPASAGQQQYGVLDVRLELVDMEAPEWARQQQQQPTAAAAAAPPVQPPGAPHVSVSGNKITFSSRKEFEDALPEGF